MVSLLNASHIRAETFFNLKGLDQAAVARLEKAVKTSKDTLALADQLQAVRDTNKALHRLERALKSTTGLNVRILDLYS